MYPQKTSTKANRSNKPQLWAIVLALLCLVFLSACSGQNRDRSKENKEPRAVPGGTNSIGMNFVQLNAASFIMGSPDNESERNDDETQHTAHLSPFLLSSTETTQQQWNAIESYNPSKHVGDKFPVEMVSWFEAVDFCNKLSLKEGLTPVYRVVNRLTSADLEANGYRLPTEAEWEYACRAGSSEPFFTGADIQVSQANYNGKYQYRNGPASLFRNQTVEAGSLPANAFGFYEMHGNVYEWCHDGFGPYATGDVYDPAGPLMANRVDRGGSYLDEPKYLRSAYRNYQEPQLRGEYLGFRVARNVTNTK